LLLAIGNECSSRRSGDANFEADKSLTTTGQKMAGEMKMTGQKLEKYSKLLTEKNLKSVIFSNRRNSRTGGRRAKNIIRDNKQTFVS
jgi:hypothetical protein